MHVLPMWSPQRAIATVFGFLLSWHVIQTNQQEFQGDCTEAEPLLPALKRSGAAYRLSLSEPPLNPLGWES